MLYCQAYPVKKLIPLDRIASAEPCLGQQFDSCPLFKDVMTRIRANTQSASLADGVVAVAPRREVFQ